MLVDNSSTDIE